MLLAVLSMPVVACASSGGERDLARVSGDSTGAAGRPADPAALTRQALRAAPPADLKFSAERGDPKAVPGGPDPAILPCPSRIARSGMIACRLAAAQDSLREAADASAYRSRAPPRQPA
ncbi:hypothetical protein BJF92_00055 [Rhizobium rhizosphaerae]|uniref:Uncharacterized protein n=2 Tax=Xaviernesmea rhizosphaerae TaxID=1672749 RepID=A0A1Q9AE89_9HYPH|nr:hypothetical protein BJF92_00055 [Xaviernesmea rhizosphaerae]OQP85829.1 hypothetical protein BTR14_13695 [Xaviernesmea rhizosphaerae]